MLLVAIAVVIMSLVIKSLMVKPLIVMSQRVGLLVAGLVVAGSLAVGFQVVLELVTLDLAVILTGCKSFDFERGYQWYLLVRWFTLVSDWSLAWTSDWSRACSRDWSLAWTSDWIRACGRVWSRALAQGVRNSLIVPTARTCRVYCCGFILALLLATNAIQFDSVRGAAWAVELKANQEALIKLMNSKAASVDLRSVGDVLIALRRKVTDNPHDQNLRLRLAGYLYLAGDLDEIGRAHV